ncbi:MAG: hypothetical protein JWN98_2501 [Abditibacteriota bacterium]|nr:hypothetical protein [Abditibacteriota bacterium]
MMKFVMPFMLNSSLARNISPLIALLCFGMMTCPQPAAAQNTTTQNTTAQSSAAGVTTTPISRSPWQIQWQGARGATLSYDGIPLIRQSSLYVVKPGWTGLLFDGRNQKYELTRGRGEHPILSVTGDNESFHAEYRFEALDARRFRLHFKGELKRDVPAAIEYSAGYFNANPLANRPFRAVTKDGTKSGTIAAYPATSDQYANDVAPHFRSLEFDSRIGRLSIEARSQSRVIFFDARREAQEWARPAPIFWCGWLAGMQPLTFGQPVEMELTITLDALPVPPRPQLVVRPILRPIPNAQSSRERPIQIIPRPQRLQAAPLPPFQLNAKTRILILAPRGEIRLTRAVQKLLREERRLTTPAPRVRHHDQAWARIEIGRPALRTSADRHKVLWWSHKEGYFLRATPGGIEITSPSAQGAFYGLQTLAQLLEPHQSGALCPAVTIEDWPSLPFRGVHWFPSASGAGFHKKMIERVLSRHKINACVIQSEAARWDTNPKMAAPNSISKDDLRALVQVCRENFIEPIPLINVPGHAEWMFRNGQNLDLAEDPQTPYAYSVNNPKSLLFVQQVLDEAIEVFQPKYLHLGHDEVTMHGRFPNPENPFYESGKSAGDLVIENLRHLHGWLKERGVQTMIWGDMLIAPEEGVDAAHAPSTEEAKRRRALVPRDVIITDWHYGSNESYPSLELFKSAGLSTIAATWHTPLNIHFFTRAAKASGARGVLQTTWAGYFPDESTLNSEARQFAAFILAGDYAWSTRQEMPPALPYDAISEWPRALNARTETIPERGGAPVDLSPAAHVNAEDWLGLGPDWDLSAFFTAPTMHFQTKAATSSALPARRYGDVLFNIADNRFVVLASPQARSLAPAGALNQLTIETDRTAREIAVLHAGLWHVARNTCIARLLVDYNDGTQSTWELVQGRNTSAWNADANAPEAQRGWMAPPTPRTPRDVPFVLRVTRWQNPHPEKPIARLRFQAVSPETAWTLGGLTLLN